MSGNTPRRLGPAHTPACIFLPDDWPAAPHHTCRRRHEAADRATSCPPPPTPAPLPPDPTPIRGTVLWLQASFALYTVEATALLQRWAALGATDASGVAAAFRASGGCSPAAWLAGCSVMASSSQQEAARQLPAACWAARVWVQAKG
jgi:hypothetical protein